MPRGMRRATCPALRRRSDNRLTDTRSRTSTVSLSSCAGWPTVMRAIPLAAITRPFALRLQRLLREPEDHELGRFHRCDPDLADQLTGVPRFRRVRFPVALHVERLIRRHPEQGAAPPNTIEERADVALDPRPEIGVVWLEDDPLRALLDRFLDEVEEPPNVDVAPARIARQCARAPRANPHTRERPNAIDAHR